MSPTSLLRGIAFLLLLQWISTLIIGKVIPASSIEGICDILISKMGMLFLPAGVSVLLYVDVIKAEFVPIVATTIICSIVVLTITAFFLQSVLKGKENH